MKKGFNFLNGNKLPGRITSCLPQPAKLNQTIFNRAVGVLFNPKQRCWIKLKFLNNFREPRKINRLSIHAQVEARKEQPPWLGEREAQFACPD